MTRVEISTGARLHFGLLCGPSGGCWHYGGIGLMLDQPAWNLTIAENRDSAEDIFDTSAAVAERAGRLLTQFRATRPQLPSVRISTRNEVNFHSGLGSGTQLTVGLGTAFLLLCGEPRSSGSEQLAEELGRSRRSAIGTYGFDHGGFIVDEGRSVNHIQRLRFPDDWRMVLLTPLASIGLSGETEEAFFGKRSFLTPEAVQEFDRLVREDIVPAVEQADFDKFRRSLGDYGNAVGRYYASAQGGIFANSTVRAVVESLAQLSFGGAVQSSWGPTTCIPAAGENDAQEIRRAVFRHVGLEAMHVTIARGLNTGATIRTPSPQDYRSFG